MWIKQVLISNKHKVFVGAFSTPYPLVGRAIEDGSRAKSPPARGIIGRVKTAKRKRKQTSAHLIHQTVSSPPRLAFRGPRPRLKHQRAELSASHRCGSHSKSRGGEICISRARYRSRKSGLRAEGNEVYRRARFRILIGRSVSGRRGPSGAASVNARTCRCASDSPALLFNEPRLNGSRRPIAPLCFCRF